MITYTLRNALRKGRSALNLKKRLLAAGVVLTLTSLTGSAQFVLKTNVLYDATTTPNLGAELVLSRKSTVNLVYGLNPWKFSSKKHGQRYAKHWVVMPEYRWWTCSALDGHFIGVHAMGGQFNAQNVDLPIPGGFFGCDKHSRNIAREVRDSRYEGTYAGVGFTYGYQWPLSKHWNIEAEAEDCMLLDLATGDSQPIYEGMEIPVTGSSNGRYYITRGGTQDGIRAIRIECNGNTVTVSTGRQNIRVDVFDTNCSCSVGSYPHEEIAPGDTAEIIIKFSARDRRPGRVHKYIYIRSTSSVPRSVAFLKANVK